MISNRTYITFAASLACLMMCSLASAGQSSLRPTRVEAPRFIQDSTLVGHLDPATRISLNLALKVPNPGTLRNFLDDLSNPHSPTYAHWITPQQFGRMFGQPPKVVKTAVDYLKSKGLKVTLVAANNLNIEAVGTVAQVEDAFGTTINRYHAVHPKDPGRTDYFAYSTTLHAPSSIANLVLSVDGLQDYAMPHPMTTLTPAMTHVLYNSVPYFSTGFTGSGRTVGISNWDGFSLSNVPIFYSTYNLPVPPGGVGSNITVEMIDGGTSNPSGEGDLDIQMVLAGAPLCNLIIYDGNFGAADLLNVLTAEVNENKADIFTESYGWATGGVPTIADAAHQIHQQMTAQGQTYMNASGDYGTAVDPYSYPDFDPETLSVGGTAADTTNTGSRNSEVGWNGSGGGYSAATNAFNVRPAYQVATGVPNLNFRLVPDVALVAAGDQAGYTGAYFFVLGGQLTTAEGTSFASPVFAGNLASAEQKLISIGWQGTQNTKRFGRINDLFYQQNLRPDIWFDVTVGNNGTLLNGNPSNAGTGWDTVTGLGCINFNAFVNSQAGSLGTVVLPHSVGIYANQGKNPTGGLAQIFSVDNTYYTINSVSSNLGQVAAAAITFAVNSNNLTSLSLKVNAKAVNGVSEFIYAYDYSKQQYVLLATVPLTGGTAKTATLNLANPMRFVSGGDLQIVARAILPSRISSSTYTYKIDMANAVEYNSSGGG